MIRALALALACASLSACAAPNVAQTTLTYNTRAMAAQRHDLTNQADDADYCGTLALADRKQRQWDVKGIVVGGVNQAPEGIALGSVVAQPLLGAGAGFTLGVVQGISNNVTWFNSTEVSVWSNCMYDIGYRFAR